MRPTTALILLLPALLLGACQSMPSQPAQDTAAVTSLDQPVTATTNDTSKQTETTALGKSSKVAKNESISTLPSKSVKAATNTLTESRKPGVIYQHSDGIEMRYNAKLGVYDVINMQDMYFHKQFYLRYAKQAWLVATQFDGPWLEAKPAQIPNSLAKSKLHSQARVR